MTSENTLTDYFNEGRDIVEDDSISREHKLEYMRALNQSIIENNFDIVEAALQKMNRIYDAPRSPEETERMRIAQQGNNDKAV